MATQKRYYYKKDGKPAYNLKEPLENILDDVTDYIEITEAEWNELTYVAPHTPTAAEIAHNEAVTEINACKKFLNETDYIIIKIAEAETVEEQNAIRVEYSSVIAERKAKRARINELEVE